MLRIYEIGWFSTGRDKAARDLLKVVHESCNREELPNLRISFIFINRAKGESDESDLFFELAGGLGIKTLSFSSEDFKSGLRRRGLQEEMNGRCFLLQRWRRLYDREIMRRIGRFGPTLIILAGYMLILGDEMCNEYPIINLHPAVPGGPKGTWQEVIWKLIEKEATESGAMIHLVTPQLDAGSPLTYCRFPITNGKFKGLWKSMKNKLQNKTSREIQDDEGENEPLFQAIRTQGIRVEIPLVLHTLKALSEGDIEVKAGGVLRKGKSIPGLLLDEKTLETLWSFGSREMTNG